MRKVQQYRQRARECRIAAARVSTTELQHHYTNLAAVWEKLADERLAFFVDHPPEETERETERRRVS